MMEDTEKLDGRENSKKRKEVSSVK